MAESKDTQERDVEEFKTWWDSLTPEEKRERARRHQGGDNPVHVYPRRVPTPDGPGDVDISIDDSDHYVSADPSIKPKYKTREEWLRAIAEGKEEPIG